jgi:histidine triad (HIT) family protein
MVSQEQLSQLKEQVISQINSTFPEAKKEQAIKQINSMDDSQFIEFLKQNDLIKNSETENSEESGNENKTPFRLIVEGKIPSYEINQNKEAIAVLEINPISKAHVLIIPKIPVNESNKLPKAAFLLAKNISKKITSKFKPKEVLIASSAVLGEIIINIVPKYSNETLNSERKSSSKEELEKLKTDLEVKKRAKPIKQPKVKEVKEKIWLPKRIP